ncbi:unnamed protein product [Albugo candida]|uniref:Uncharacterized protein n=1 Tax=Albugo candida TaxID=65357 RepID=A0A024GP41_9STRA|nr:unnamed protein product [Albugo candida]|eukprot:CCI48482.1 unnamed protein product [Albugo candida]
MFHSSQRSCRNKVASGLTLRAGNSMFISPVPFVEEWQSAPRPAQKNNACDDASPRLMSNSSAIRTLSYEKSLYIEPPLFCGILSLQHESVGDKIEYEELDYNQTIYEKESEMSDSENDFELVLSDEWKSLLRFQRGKPLQPKEILQKKKSNTYSNTGSINKKHSSATKRKKKTTVRWQDRLRAEVSDGNADAAILDDIIRSMSVSDTQRNHLKQLETTIEEKFEQLCRSSKRVMWPAYSID